MAITLYGSSDGYPSLHDEIYHVAESTNAASANFKYIYDIKIGGVLVSRLKVFPDPASDKGIANISNVLRNYWQSYFNVLATPYLLTYSGNDNFVEYTLEVGEDINGVITPNLASLTAKAWNFVYPPFREFAISYYSQKINKFITNRDLSQLTYNGSENLYVSFGRLTSASYIISINNGITTATKVETFNTFTLLNLSPEAINNSLGYTFISDTTPKWTVTINGITATVTRVCSRFDTCVLHFLNDLGGYDTMAFRLVNREIRNIERKTYKQRGWALSGNYMEPVSNRKLVGGNIEFVTNQKVNYSLISDYVSQTDYTWLRELISSPEVYFERGGYYYPALITDNTWTEKKRINDKLFNLSLNVELVETNSQYR